MWGKTITDSWFWKYVCKFIRKIHNRITGSIFRFIFKFVEQNIIYFSHLVPKIENIKKWKENLIKIVSLEPMAWPRIEYSSLLRLKLTLGWDWFSLFFALLLSVLLFNRKTDLFVQELTFFSFWYLKGLFVYSFWYVIERLKSFEFMQRHT